MTVSLLYRYHDSSFLMHHLLTLLACDDHTHRQRDRLQDEAAHIHRSPERAARRQYHLTTSDQMMRVSTERHGGRQARNAQRDGMYVNDVILFRRIFCACALHVVSLFLVSTLLTVIALDSHVITFIERSE